MTRLTNSIPTVKVPAMMPLQQLRCFRTSSRRERTNPGAAAADYPAAARPPLWLLPSQTSSPVSCVRFTFGRVCRNLSSLFRSPDSYFFGRDRVNGNCGRSAFAGRFNRLAGYAADFIPVQRSQQKIYRVAIFGPCRIAAPEDVPA